MKNIHILACFASTCLAISGAHGQFVLTPGNIVQNGSFENGIDPGLTSAIYAPNSTTIPGWTVSAGEIDYVGIRWAAADGVRMLDMSGYVAGTIYQDLVGLTLGQAYRLTFAMAGNPESLPWVKDMRVTIGSTYSQDFSFDGFGYTPSNMGWSDRTLDFVATDASMRLTFISLENGWAGAALDNVRVVAVPEPTGASLLVIGSVIVGILRRKP